MGAVGGEGHFSCMPKGTPQNYNRTLVSIFENIDFVKKREKESNRN